MRGAAVFCVQELARMKAKHSQRLAAAGQGGAGQTPLNECLAVSRDLELMCSCSLGNSNAL